MVVHITHKYDGGGGNVSMWTLVVDFRDVVAIMTLHVSYTYIRFIVYEKLWPESV